MKKPFLKRFSLPIAFFILLLINSCTKTNDRNENIYILMGNASGSQEVPAVASYGTASLNGTYNADDKVMNYLISWSGLSDRVNAVNLHGPATIGASADISMELMINDFSSTGKASGTVTFDDSMVNALLNGNLYYNINSVAYPNGEIRGQIMAIHE
jgi:hypothetical protein